MENWYVILDGATLGPFEKEDLKFKLGFNPDTLVWKDGFEGWIPAREVPELDELFKDPKTIDHEEQSPIKENFENEEGPEGALVMVNSEPPFFGIWLIFALILFIYLIYQIYN